MRDVSWFITPALTVLAALALFSTRWTSYTPMRSASLTAATILLAIVIVRRRRTRDPLAMDNAYVAGRIADAAVLGATGIAAGSTEGPVLGVTAMGVVSGLQYVRRAGGVGPATWWLAVLLLAAAVGAVLIWFGRWLHAWMLVPLIVVIVGAGTEILMRLPAAFGRDRAGPPPEPPAESATGRAHD